MSRKNANIFNMKLRDKTIKNIHLVTFNHQLANRIRKIHINEFKVVENKLPRILTFELFCDRIWFSKVV